MIPDVAARCAVGFRAVTSVLKHIHGPFTLQTRDFEYLVPWYLVM